MHELAEYYDPAVIRKVLQFFATQQYVLKFLKFGTVYSVKGQNSHKQLSVGEQAGW